MECKKKNEIENKAEQNHVYITDCLFFLVYESISYILLNNILLFLSEIYANQIFCCQTFICILNISKLIIISIIFLHLLTKPYSK